MHDEPAPDEPAQRSFFHPAVWDDPVCLAMLEPLRRAVADFAEQLERWAEWARRLESLEPFESAETAVPPSCFLEYEASRDQGRKSEDGTS